MIKHCIKYLLLFIFTIKMASSTIEKTTLFLENNKTSFQLSNTEKENNTEKEIEVIEDFENEFTKTSLFIIETYNSEKNKRISYLFKNPIEYFTDIYLPPPESYNS